MNRRALLAAGSAFALLGCVGQQKVDDALAAAGDWAKQAQQKVQQAQFLLGQLDAQLSIWRPSIPADLRPKLDAAVGKAHAALDAAAQLVALGGEKVDEAKQAWSGNWLPAINDALKLLAELGMFVPALARLQPPPAASLRADGQAGGVGFVQLTLPAEEL